MALIWIDPNYCGSLCSNPNKIQTNDMVGGVIYFLVFMSRITRFCMLICTKGKDKLGQKDKKTEGQKDRRTKRQKDKKTTRKTQEASTKIPMN